MSQNMAELSVRHRAPRAVFLPAGQRRLELPNWISLSAFLKRLLTPREVLPYEIYSEITIPVLEKVHERTHRNAICGEGEQVGIEQNEKLNTISLEWRPQVVSMEFLRLSRVDPAFRADLRWRKAAHLSSLIFSHGFLGMMKIWKCL